MILQDVDALTHADQRRLLDWLDQAAGRTQVVSTTPAPLLPRVQAGAFIDRLYYRLNTVCMDVTEYLADAPGAGLSGRIIDLPGHPFRAASLADGVPAQSR
jgi:sigma-54-interacting transcriptional regulator